MQANAPRNGKNQDDGTPFVPESTPPQTPPENGDSRVRRETRRLLTFLAISLLIHLLSVMTAGIYSRYQAANRPPAPKRVTVRLQQTDAEKAAQAKKQMQIVQQKKTNTNEPENKDADFWSMQNQKTKENQRAQRIDDFTHHPENRANLPPQPGLKAQQEQKPKTQKESETKKLSKETAEGPGRGKKKPKNSKELVKNLFSSLDDELIKRQPASAAIPDSSATDDYLQDIKLGNSTLLNTREFKYYSYFERVRAQLKQYWRPIIQQKFDQMAALAGGNPNVKGEKITKLHVKLDSDGNIEKITVMRSSGVGEIDSAAIEAFDRAGPFPNPPSGLIEKEGGINLQWEFVLVVNS